MAGAMLSLDLILSVDAAPAHLAGALGKPIWTLLSSTPDARWQPEGDTTPWYPTMRLFRQTRPGDWHDVFVRMTQSLHKLTDYLAT
jgi:ADP-heptose:LPS heptosyltransferase